MTAFARSTSALLFACALGVSSALAEDPGPSIIPEPLTVRAMTGHFVLADGAIISTPQGDADARRAATYFADLLRRTRGLALTVREGAPRPGEIVFARGAASGEDAYRLQVAPDQVTITAADFGGLFYGGVSLWQLATAQGAEGPARIAAVDITDAPRFGWRGLMLDSARQYQSPEFIKSFIDWMALHKLNVFHWHLTDDQAWRPEIRRYPRLTEVGGWSVPAGASARADIDPATGQPRKHGGIYTQAQVREIVAYAQARNITIVPEVDVPGHASAAVAAYPELGVTDIPGAAVTAVPTDWGIYQTLFNVEDSTLVFFENVFDEVMELFPSEYIHIGGDEAVKNQWKASPRVQERMRELGVTDEEALQSWFVARLERHLNAKGRRMIGWDEILEGGLAPNATVMSWRGIDGAIEAARLGHDTVMAPAPTVYFDHRQAEDAAPGRARTVSLRDVYTLDPTPDTLTEAQAAHVLGVQANLWTEHMRNEARIEYQAYPRVAALSEIAWSAHERLNYDDFRARLETQLARYRVLGIDYAETGLTETVAVIPPDGQRRYDHQLKLCSAHLALALIDDAPLVGERPAFLVDIMNPCWTYEAADLSAGARIEVAVGQVPFNFQIGAQREQIKLATPRTAEGELEVHAGTCEAEPIAVLPLQAAAASNEVTVLTARLPALQGRQDLCFRFAQHGLDPLWAIDWVRIEKAGQ